MKDGETKRWRRTSKGEVREVRRERNEEIEIVVAMRKGSKDGEIKME